MQVCFNRVAPRVLHFISSQLVLQADASALVVAQIQQHPAASSADDFHRHFQLRPAVAPLRPEHIACDAFGMDAHQHRLAVFYFAQHAS